MTPQDFINLFLPDALRLYQTRGILPSLTLAVAANESGWGGSGLATNYNNYFGIKGMGTAGSVTLNSGEYDVASGKWSNPPSDFRVYNNPSESVFDFGRVLSKDRYAGIANALDLKSAANIMKNGGYATDPGYVGKILNIASKYNLTQYDPDPSKPRALDTNNDGILDFMYSNATDYKIIQTAIAPPLPPLTPNDPDWVNPQDRTDPNSPFYNPNATPDNATGLSPWALDHMNGVDRDFLSNILWFLFGGILLVFGLYFMFKEPIGEAAKEIVTKGVIK